MENSLVQEGVEVACPELPPVAEAAPLDTKASGPLQWGADILFERFGTKVGKVSEPSGEVSRRTLMRRVRSAAELGLLHQDEQLHSLLGHIRTMSKLRLWRAIACLEHLAYDETMVNLRFCFEGQNKSERQVGRVYVIERAWTFLVEVLPTELHIEGPVQKKFCVFEMNMCPQIRASENATGDTIAAVLQSLAKKDLELSNLFPWRIRLAETDECGANLRAEAIILHNRAQQNHDVWGHLQVSCLAHKAHDCASRTWALMPAVISGIIQVCKHLNQAGSMATLCESVSGLIAGRLRVVVGDAAPLSREALKFREIVLQYFSPPPQQLRRRAAMLAALEYFNSDLRRKDIIHFCRGSECCRSPDESKAKGIVLMKHLTMSLRPEMFSRSNWTAWTSTLRFFGVATSLHCGLIVEAFHLAFRGRPVAHDVPGPCDIPDAPTDTDICLGILDDTAAEQTHLPDTTYTDQDRGIQESAKNLRLALQYFSSDPLELMQQIWLLRIPLEPQRLLMKFLTHNISAGWEEAQWKQMWERGARDLRPLLLHDGLELRGFFLRVMDQYCDEDLWREFPASEQFSSQLFRTCMRSGAVAFQLIHLRVVHLPYRLFVSSSS